MASSEENPNTQDRAAKAQAKNDKKKAYWKAARIAAVIGIIEIFALVGWVKSEDFGDDVARKLRWIASCGFLAGGAYLAHKFSGGRHRKLIIKGIWVAWVVVCVVLLITSQKHSEPNPKPHFVWSLQIEGFPDTKLILTNAHFFDGTVKKAGFKMPGGEDAFLVKVPAVIVVPVLDEESNKVFTFKAENNSMIGAKDAQFVFGVSKEWNLGVDTNKWDDIDGGMILHYGMESALNISPTNMQYFAARKPVTLGPFDAISFSITNIRPLKVFNGPNPRPVIELAIRVLDLNSKPFDQMLFSNVIFVPTSVHVFKPALIFCKMDAESGVIPPTDQDFIESQMK